MNLKLVRKVRALYGITGALSSLSGGDPIAVTLEHAYQQPDGTFLPKLAPGLYTCERHPPNRLHYETFMVKGVPPFMGAPVDGILIHRGNWNRESEGCVLVGTHLGTGCILESEKAFDQLMELQKGIEQFQLLVSG